MEILNLNCQKGYQAGLEAFLKETLSKGNYDILLLQEVSDQIALFVQHPAYETIRVFSEELGRDNELCILYRKGYKLLGQGFKSFAAMRRDPVREFKHPCFGVLFIDLEIKGERIRFATTHLHSGLDRQVRFRETVLAKEFILQEAPKTILIAGDFNAGFPYEHLALAKVFEPEFLWLTRNCPATLDSRYSENVGHLPNRIAAFLSLFNIGIKLKADHIFMHSQSGAVSAGKCVILPERISDHSPIKLNLHFN